MLMLEGGWSYQQKAIYAVNPVQNILQKIKKSGKV